MRLCRRLQMLATEWMLMIGYDAATALINFNATDIYRIADGPIAQNWRLEDNLTFQQQLGLIGE